MLGEIVLGITLSIAVFFVICNIPNTIRTRENDLLRSLVHLLENDQYHISEFNVSRHDGVDIGQLRAGKFRIDIFDSSVTKLRPIFHTGGDIIIIPPSLSARSWIYRRRYSRAIKRILDGFKQEMRNPTTEADSQILDAIDGFVTTLTINGYNIVGDIMIADSAIIDPASQAIILNIAKNGRRSAVKWGYNYNRCGGINESFEKVIDPLLGVSNVMILSPVIFHGKMVEKWETLREATLL